MKYVLLMMFFISSHMVFAKESKPLEQKTGSLIWIGFEGTKPGDPQVVYVKENLINTKKISGVILFKRNIESPAQLSSLISYLKEGTPDLFVSVDQEGGKVQRLNASNGFTAFPSAQSMAGKTDEEISRIYGQMAQELRDVGVNCNLGPVVDVNGFPLCNVIGGFERSFGSDPSRIAHLARLFIQEHSGRGIMTSLKHFLGHGSASGDTHEDIVDVTLTWSEKELEPYVELFKIIPSSTMVMTAHLVHKGLDPDFPSTLSNKILTGVLRNKLGFNGAIISDDLHMGAILKRCGENQESAQAQAAVLGLKAGVTFLLYGNNPLAAKGYEGFVADVTLPVKIIDAVKLAIEQGDAELEAAVNSAYEIAQRTKSCLHPSSF